MQSGKKIIVYVKLYYITSKIYLIKKLTPMVGVAPKLTDCDNLKIATSFCKFDGLNKGCEKILITVKVWNGMTSDKPSHLPN